jgi:predicted enzyme related to lactoylglutathione lyase
MAGGPARYGGREDVVLAVVLDCADLDRSATFWCAALGYVAETADGTALADLNAQDRYRRLLPADGDGVELLLQRVAEPKVAKNRVHLDLRVPDLHDEVARLVALGATHTADAAIEEDGWIWYVLADPDGNEFCVLRPPRT